MTDPANLCSQYLDTSRVVVGSLRERDVEVRLVGSVSRGDVHENSDMDFLILKCPSEIRDNIFFEIERMVDGAPFDLIFLDEVTSDYWRQRLLEEAIEPLTEHRPASLVPDQFWSDMLVRLHDLSREIRNLDMIRDRHHAELRINDWITVRAFSGFLAKAATVMAKSVARVRRRDPDFHLGAEFETQLSLLRHVRDSIWRGGETEDEVTGTELRDALTALKSSHSTFSEFVIERSRMEHSKRNSDDNATGPLGPK